MPWSGSRQTFVAHSACDCTIGHSRRGRRSRVAGVEQDRVEHRAEDVVLALVERAVADPHGPRAGVAGEVVTGRLGQVATAVDPVHDLERAVLGGLEVGDELHELVGLPVEVEAVERLQRERRVAHPGVAVVPVALAAGRLRERRGQRRDRGAGGHVGQALDRQGGALDRVAEAVVGDARPAEPGPPEARSSRPSSPPPRPRSRARRAPPPRRGRSRRALRPRACAVRGRGCPRCRARGPSGGGSSARRRWRRRRAGRRRRGPTPPARGRSRRRARRPARPRPGRRCTRRSGRACGRRRRRPAASCGA